MSKKILQAAAGNAGGESVYVDDVFSTYLYEGTGTTNNIINDVDLTEGGLVWFKRRDGAVDHNLVDSERGINKGLESNTTDAETGSAGVTAFNSDGFTVDFGFDKTNVSGQDYVSWSFRKQAGFFDVVTYTGNGTSQVINHNLSATIGSIFIKRTDSSFDWKVFHRSLGTSQELELNQTGAAASTGGTVTAVSDSSFTVGGGSGVNASGGSYVAYLFASDDQSFGDNSDESIIKCGSYTGDGTSGHLIDVGFEPQWLLVKRATGTSRWFLIDSMRGFFKPPAVLEANSSAAEQPNVTDGFSPTATGFKVEEGWGEINASGNDYIYIAIRRPMKTPESGTEVFSPSFRITGDPTVASGFVTDMGIVATRTGGGTSDYHLIGSRLTGNLGMTTTSTSAEVTRGKELTWDYNDGWGGSDTASSFAAWYSFKRATGFFDVVAYEGNGSPSNTVRRNLNHNLGVTPELAILKRRDSTSEWQVGVNGTSLYLNLSNGSAGTYTHSSYFNATDFDVEGWVTEANNNVSGSDYIVYLFATLAGVSKVGSYTGTGSDINVDCGFSSAARFVLIKRTDASAGWIVFDSARGIVSGNDPYLFLNSTSAETSTDDMIDPYSSGFTVHPNGTAINTSGGEYIFLAIA